MFPFAHPSAATTHHQPLSPVPPSVSTSAPSITASSLSVDQVQQLIAFLSSQLQQPHHDSPPNPAINSSVSHVMGNILSSSCFSHSNVARDVWVIDTGATHHVCCDISFFSHCEPIQNMNIMLPNGDTVAIDQIGTVHLSNNFHLDNVLFVPLFTFNLLSISALTLSHNCCVNFLSNSCVIQDLT